MCSAAGVPEAEAPQAKALTLVGASNFLADDRQWFAPRARRKKIALIRLAARNDGSHPITVDFAGSRLSVAGQHHEARSGETITRKLSTFQWDFLFYWILHFSIIELAIEISLFLAGTLVNRSLRKRLSSILDRPLTLRPGEGVEGIVAFQKVTNVEGAALEVPWSVDGVHFECARRGLEQT